jgi:proline-specific peptidase
MNCRRMSTTSTPSSVPVQEGTIPFAVGGDTLATWYKVVGDLDGRKTRPLVLLHGGPGFSHDYLLPLADLAVDRPVIFYDQVGSGRSSTAVDKPQTFWTFDLFIDELINLLRHFQIESDFDVLGHSWGGMLLCEYILRRKPAGLKHAVWSNSPASAASMTQSRIQQVLELPQWVQDEVKKGWRNDPEFRKALQVFSVKHHCRLEPQPAEFRKCIDYGFANDHVLRGLCVPPSSNGTCLTSTLATRTRVPNNAGRPWDVCSRSRCRPCS